MARASDAAVAEIDDLLRGADPAFMRKVDELENARTQLRLRLQLAGVEDRRLLEAIERFVDAKFEMLLAKRSA
jgi:hypothetical protein